MKNLDKPAYGHGDHINGGDPGKSKREYACIHLGIPESGDPEIDELIRKSERKRIAEKTLQGILANVNVHLPDAEVIAIQKADELIKQLNT